MQPLVAKRPTQPPRDAVARDSAPRDPAPSRMQYRMHRLWLTPVFRALLRVGLPAFVIVLSVGIWFSDEMRRAHFIEQIAQIKRDLRDRPEFMVKLMAIDGTSPEIAEAIRELLPVNLPVSSFSLDLEELRKAVVEIDAVDRAELRLAPGGILQVDITERVPVAIWRTDGRLELIDATGHRVATLLSREARPDLPLLAGPGADLAVAEAQSLIAAAQPTSPWNNSPVAMCGIIAFTASMVGQ